MSGFRLGGAPATRDRSGAMPAAAYRQYAGEPPTDPTDELHAETGTFTSATATLASSIDPSITNLAYKRVHLPGATEYVPLIVIPGFAQSYAAGFTDAFLERLASYRDPDTGRAFLVIAVTTRGRGNDGTEDCVRSSYDIVDMLDHAVANAGVTVFGSGKSAVLSGYSTGSHGALLFMRRFPDRVLGVVCNWPNFDLIEYYSRISETLRTTYLDVWLGDLRLRPVAVVDKYRASNPIDKLGEFMAADGAAPLWTFADNDDPDAVPLPHHDRLIEACQSFPAGAAITHAHVSGSGDSIRYRHDGGISSAATIYSERMWVPAMLGSPAERVFPRSGRARVLGFLETRRDVDTGRPGFAVWLGPNTNPRGDAYTDAVTQCGGQGYVADLEYDDSGTTYRLDLRTTTSGHAQVIRHLDDRRQAITAGAPLLVDLNVAPTYADLEAAGMEHDFTAETGTTGTAPVTALADQIGALSFTAVAGPTLGTDGDGAKYLGFAAASSQYMSLSQLAFDPREDFTLVLVVDKTSSDSTYYFSVSHHGTKAELAVWHNSTEKGTYLLDSTGTYGTETSNGVGNHTFSLNAKHVIVMRRHTKVDGTSVLGISVGGSNWSESDILADTFTTTGTNTTQIGAAWADGGSVIWKHLTGRIYRVAWCQSAKSDSEIAGMIARAKTDHAIT
jgi:pimeloyl-ACP methyl ester carboxylesterase